MKTIKQILLGLIFVSLSAMCFISCDEDEDRERPSTDTGTTTDTDTTATGGEDTVIVDPGVHTADICIECGENYVQNSGMMVEADNAIGEIINDTLDVVCQLYRFGNYYLLNFLLHASGVGKTGVYIVGMICNQNSIKDKLDYIWNNYSSDGRDHWGTALKPTIKRVRVKGIWSFHITNKSDYEGPWMIDPSEDYDPYCYDKTYSRVFYYIGVKILDIEKTDEEFEWMQNGINLEWYYDQAIRYAYYGENPDEWLCK